jgi:hypothetical protein
MWSRRRRALLVLCAVVSACTSHHSAPPSAPPTSETVLLPDQAIVDGTLTAAHVVDAVAPALPLPVTITIPERGHGGLRIETGRGTIAWDGGQPLPLTGTGTIDLGPAMLDIDSGGITWHLDGAPRLLTPGRYVAGSTVAVGTSGLARPEERATFTVDPGATASMVTAGDARIRTTTIALSLTGPGDMTLSGFLSVHTAGATRAGHRVTFGRGAFEVRLTPTVGGVTITALLQGPISVQ